MNHHVPLHRKKNKYYQNISLQNKNKTETIEPLQISHQQMPYANNRYTFMKLSTLKQPQIQLQHNQRHSNHEQLSTVYYSRRQTAGGYYPNQISKVSPMQNNRTAETFSLQDHYKKINALLQNQSDNLKQQNEQLSIRCNQLLKKKEKYKKLYESNKFALQAAIQEKQTYKIKVQQLMQIIQKDMKTFHMKLVQKSQEESLDLVENQEQLSIFPDKINLSNKCSEIENENFLVQQPQYSNFYRNSPKFCQNLSQNGFISEQLQQKQFPTTASKKYQIEKNGKYKF